MRLQSSSAAPPWLEAASCSSFEVSPGLAEGWSSNRAVGARDKSGGEVAAALTSQRGKLNVSEARCEPHLSQGGGLGAWGLGAGRHHVGDLRLEFGNLVLV